MVLAKRFVLFLLGSLIIFFIAFWGFKNNFPGESIANLLKINLTKQTGLSFEISDLNLGWHKISTDKITIFSPKWFSGENKINLLVFEEIESRFEAQ